MIMNLVANASLEVKLGSPKQPGESFAESRRVVGFDAAQESHVVIKPKFSCRCTILHDKFDTIRPVDHCDNRGDGYETAHKYNRKKKGKSTVDPSFAMTLNLVRLICFGYSRSEQSGYI